MSDSSGATALARTSRFAPCLRGRRDQEQARCGGVEVPDRHLVCRSADGPARASFTAARERLGRGRCAMAGGFASAGARCPGRAADLHALADRRLADGSSYRARARLAQRDRRGGQPINAPPPERAGRIETRDEGSREGARGNGCALRRRTWIQVRPAGGRGLGRCSAFGTRRATRGCLQRRCAATVEGRPALFRQVVREDGVLQLRQTALPRMERAAQLAFAEASVGGPC
jgi:hypothetical protein